MNFIRIYLYLLKISESDVLTFGEELNEYRQC